MSNYNSSEPTLGDTLIAFLLSAHSTSEFYRIRKERAFARRSDGALQVTLSRLKKKGLVDKNKEGWFITKEGREYTEQINLFDQIPSPFKKGEPAKCIVSFDIIQAKRKERDWLRNQLQTFGYRMLQQSLWSGPGPLPKEFTERVSNLGIKNGVKVFLIT